jgi:hypothetical protein
MRNRNRLVLAVGVALLGGCAGMQPGPANMSFFVTSTGPGKGGNLGGLAGADAHCQSLAAAAGAGGRTWRAYLSTQATGALTDPNFVNARDRIGAGPWRNAKGEVIAQSVDDLHSNNSINKDTAVDERGQRVNNRTDRPIKHDILTGSRTDGTAFPGPPFGDMTCGNWTKGGVEGSAMTGHFDRAGPLAATWATSWNSSHPTTGCDMEKIRSTGGDGLLYCFATN